MQRARAARCVQVAGCSLVAAHSRCACGVGLGVLETYLWHSSWSAEREISTSSSGKCGAADSPCAPPERVPSCASAPACASRARVCQRAVGQRGTAEPLPRHCSHRLAVAGLYLNFFVETVDDQGLHRRLLVELPLAAPCGALSTRLSRSGSRGAHMGPGGSGSDARDLSALQVPPSPVGSSRGPEAWGPLS